MLVTTLVEHSIVSNHIYVPKELQHRLRQVGERLLPVVTPISCWPIPSAAAHHATGNTVNIIAPKSTSTTVIVPQSLRSISNFIGFMQTTVKLFEDQVSNLAKQMTSLTVLSIVQEHKIDCPSIVLLPHDQLFIFDFPFDNYLFSSMIAERKERQTFTNLFHQWLSVILPTACSKTLTLLLYNTQATRSRYLEVRSSLDDLQLTVIALIETGIVGENELYVP
ncbi:unnamed protein product [Rotaria sordida]|uniref:Uncharacterized protein n=1 Tax=Rotaria sordida TaxID=392033 RepID=A0A813SB39_9BILA|nr:unnamed protein product [Rotaria sordida]